MQITKREEFLLLADVLEISVEELRLNLKNIDLSAEQNAKFQQYLQRVRNGEPISKIIHKRAFWNDIFFVNNDVLDPRPETELIIETAMQHISVEQSINILDLGTGSGCLILSLLREYKHARGIGIDVSEKAIAVARKNQDVLQIDNVDFFCVGWDDFKTDVRFDLIVSNPPYIRSEEINSLDQNVKKYDPWLALDGGISGLKCYEEIIPLLHNWLKSNGVFLCEVGYDQAKSVASIMNSNGFSDVQIYNDLAEIPRVVSGRIS